MALSPCDTLLNVAQNDPLVPGNNDSSFLDGLIEMDLGKCDVSTATYLFRSGAADDQWSKSYYTY